MDLKSFAENVAKFGLPILGAALPIPGGAALGAALASYIGSPSAKPEDILATLSTSAEAVLKAKEFEAEHREAILKICVDYETALQNSQKDVIVSEAKGESVLQRNWRPLLMLWFGILIGLYWFGVSPPNMSQSTIDQLFELMKLGIGGYVIGRSVEKTAATAAQYFGGRN